MSNRENFPRPVCDALAKRAGFRCSFPTCSMVSIGPSDESESAVSATGMACHIVAASDEKPARRRDADYPKEKLRDITNGVWMCYTHGKLIDTDEALFTVEMLRSWRELAEAKARVRQQTGMEPVLGVAELSKIPIPSGSHSFTQIGGENSIIGDLVEACALRSIWGERAADSAKDYSIEHIRNAFTHGFASLINYTITGRSITITDDGKKFDPFTLSSQAKRQGGSLCFDQLKRCGIDGIFLVNTTDEHGHNVFKIFRPHSRDDVEKETKCVIKLERPVSGPVFARFSSIESCGVLYVFLPDDTVASDILSWIRDIRQLPIKGKYLVFVGSRISGHTIQMLGYEFPGCPFYKI